MILTAGDVSAQTVAREPMWRVLARRAGQAIGFICLVMASLMLLMWMWQGVSLVIAARSNLGRVIGGLWVVIAGVTLLNLLMWRGTLPSWARAARATAAGAVLAAFIALLMAGPIIR
jgi:hypothetical protein